MNNRVSIITIGDEILIGQIIDTNSAWLGEQLFQRGMDLNQIITCKDDAHSITDALDYAKGISDSIIITGGLGPTKDDITKKVLADFLDDKLEFSEEQWKHLQNYFHNRDRKLSQLHENQAMAPSRASHLYNPIGTALGVLMEKDNITYLCLPGVPDEMKGIMNEGGFSAITKNNNGLLFKQTYMTIGISETKLAETLEPIDSRLPKNMSLSFLPGYGSVRVRLNAKSQSDPSVFNKINLLVKDKLSPYTYGENDISIEETIANILTERAQTLSTAESCTGGSIAKRLTRHAGASSYFKGSVVAYSNEAKMNLLTVPEQTLKTYGAVSEQTVTAMVRGACKALNTDYAVSTSGIAGPTGGTPEKPVGTIWIACGSQDKIITKKLQMGQDRVRNIKSTSQIALNMLRKFLLA